MLKSIRKILLATAALLTFCVNTSFIIGREKSQPVAVCIRSDHENYVGVDALITTPWESRAYVNVMVDNGKEPISLSDSELGMLSVMAALSLVACILTILIIFVVYYGRSSNSSFFLVSAMLIQGSHFIILAYFVEVVNTCRHTGALAGSLLSFIFLSLAFVFRSVADDSAVRKQRDMYGLQF